MIDHCEFPYGEPAGLFTGDFPSFLLLLLVFTVGVAAGVMASEVRRRQRGARLDPAD